MREVQLRETKVRLPVLVDKATQGKTAIITRHGKLQPVILGIHEWDRLCDVPPFGCLLLASDLQDGDLAPRDTAPPREARL